MARFLQGVSQVRIAEEFDTPKQTINNIILGKTWSHLFKEEQR